MKTASPRRILIVDDEPQVLSFLTELFSSEGWETHAAPSGSAGIEMLERERFDVVLTDLKMPGADGIEVLRAAKTIQSDAEVILMTAYSSLDSAVEAMRGGAFHYLLKPFHAEEVLHLAAKACDQRQLKRENRFLKAASRGGYQLHAVAAANPAMQEAVASVQRLADTEIPVLLAGEYGTGRGFFARVLHYHSTRSEALFVPVYCAGATEEILEDDLFGHAPGAYARAILPREGKMELANRGTLFLANLDEASPRVQDRLARSLASRTTARAGSDQEVALDIRLIASCRPDPEGLVEKGNLRRELFDALRPGLIRVPPLRERPEDIPLLLHHFLFEANQERKKPLRGFSEAALKALCAYPWPGNSRELVRLVRTISSRKKQGTIVDASDLPVEILYGKRRRKETGEPAGAPPRPDIHSAIRDIEKPMVMQALALSEDDREQAAALLRIGVAALEELMRRHGIEGTRKENPG
ncbi:MAG: sigma-54 dependent transcriptional regulator [Deltaproteobacteria bacterium]|nr:sigma-54 dependent transcriptional regulator [Deltaproteobacteria bacterium]